MSDSHTHRGVEDVEAISRLFFQNVEGDWKGDKRYGTLSNNL